MNDIPKDIEAAAISAWDVLDDSSTETWEPIARAILAERQRCAKKAAVTMTGHKPFGYDLWPDVGAAILAGEAQ